MSWYSKRRARRTQTLGQSQKRSERGYTVTYSKDGTYVLVTSNGPNKVVQRVRVGPTATEPIYTHG